MAIGASVMQTVVQIAGSLDPSLAKSLQQAQKGLSGLNKASLLAKAGLAAAGVATIKFAKDSLGTFAGFDDSMRQVQATMGLTYENNAETIEKLSNAAKEGGKATKFSASQSADALNYLALAGYGADKAIETLPKVLDLAAAGGMDLAYTSDLLTDSMSALGVGTDQLDAFMDAMAKTSQKSNTDVAQLGEAILTVGGTAKGLAGGTNELNLALGLLGDTGTKGSEAGTALRNIILGLTPTTKAAADAFKEIGLDAYDAEGKMRPLQDVFADMNAGLADMTDKEKREWIKTAFNKNDLKSVEALLGTSAERWEELGAEIENSEGATKQMAATMEGGLGGALRTLNSAVEGLQIEFGEKLAPFAVKGIGIATAAVNKLTDFIAVNWEKAAMALKPFTHQIGAVFRMLGRSGKRVLAPFNRLLSPIMESFGKGGVKGIKAFAGALNGLRVIASNAFLVLGNALDAVVDLLQGDTASAKKRVERIWGKIFGNSDSIYATLKGGISGAWGSLTQWIDGEFTEKFGASWQGVKDKFGEIFGEEGWVTTNLGPVFDALDGLKGLPTDIINGDWEGAKTKLSATFDSLKTAAKGIDWEAVKTAFKDGVKTAFIKGEEWFNSAKDWVMGGFDRIKTWAESVNWTEVKDKFIEKARSFLGTAGAWFSGARAGVLAGFDRVKEWAGSIDWAGVKDSLAEKAGYFLGRAGAWFTKAKDGVITGFNRIRSWVAGIDWAGVATKFKDKAGSILESDWFDNAKDSVIAIKDKIVAWIGDINWDNVQDSVATAGDKIVELFNGIDFSNAGQWKIEAFQRIGEVVIDMFNRIDWSSLADGALNALNGFGGVVIDLFERIDWDKVIGTATDLLNGLGETVLGLIERIPWATIISGATTATIKLGAAVVTLFQSIEWDKVIGTASFLLNGIAGAVVDLFNRINWTVFAENSGDAIAQLGQTVVGLFEQIDRLEIGTAIMELIKNIPWREAANAAGDVLGSFAKTIAELILEINWGDVIKGVASAAFDIGAGATEAAVDAAVELAGVDAEKLSSATDEVLEAYEKYGLSTEDGTLKTAAKIHALMTDADTKPIEQVREEADAFVASIKEYEDAYKEFEASQFKFFWQEEGFSWPWENTPEVNAAWEYLNERELQRQKEPANWWDDIVWPWEDTKAGAAGIEEGAEAYFSAPIEGAISGVEQLDIKGPLDVKKIEWETAWNAIRDYPLNTFDAEGLWMNSAVDGIAQGLTNAKDDVIDMSESTWKDAWDDARKVPEDAFKNLPAKLAPLIQVVTNGLSNHVTMVFTPKWKRNWESAMNVVRLAFAQLQISVNFIINRMTTKVNNLLDAISNVKMPGGGGNGDGGLPGYAAGGITRGPSIAGEDPRYPTEYVISENPMYRSRNIGILAAAGRALNLIPDDIGDSEIFGRLPRRLASRNDGGGDVYELGGITMEIHIHGHGKEAARDVVEEIRRELPEIIDMAEREVRRRKRINYEFC